MDEITRALKHGRAHFDNVLVTNPWALLWSEEYFVPRGIVPYGGFDSMGRTLLTGRNFDGHRTNQWLPRNMWKWPLTKTEVLWQRNS